jgi:proteasome lid subunit RPN8/RPN11
MNKVILREQDYDFMKWYGKSQNYEVCALLLGHNNIVKWVELTKNTEKSPVHFTISNEDLLKGYKIASKLNMDVIGIFHSHPNNKAYPSVTDERFMKTNPGVWIIYSGTEKNMKAFVLDDTYIIDPKEIEITIKN